MSELDFDSTLAVLHMFGFTRPSLVCFSFNIHANPEDVSARIVAPLCPCYVVRNQPSENTLVE